ncbi:unnamed protein product [Clavelina lepadiformis]|uniref:Mediator of RNA polymerase II transcription subunit 20 n=1 Tax=Clavelina lepadiformis TaxID=159417 RepID=A0ABP0H2Q7_CLALP
MGVTYVSQWNIPEGKNIQQGVEELQNKAEKLGAKKCGLFVVECESFHSTNAQNLKTLHTIHNSEYPASRFACFEDGSFLVTDVMLGTFLSKLRSVWQPKKGGKIESKGQRYEFGDFIIKIGIVSMGPSTKGIALELEYAPCRFPLDCWELMTEMLHELIDDQAPASLPQVIAQKPDANLAELTALQYIRLFNNLRKASMNR